MPSSRSLDPHLSPPRRSSDLTEPDSRAAQPTAPSLPDSRSAQPAAPSLPDSRAAQPAAPGTPAGLPPSAAKFISGSAFTRPDTTRSEEHTSELQSPCKLVCRRPAPSTLTFPLHDALPI